MLPSPKSLLALAGIVSVANALKFPIEKRTSHRIPFGAKTASVQTASVGSGNDTSITNKGDLLYTCPVTICGQTITVQIDTGSSDLWVAPPQPLQGVQKSNLPVTVKYGIGDVTGPVSLCTANVGKYSVPNQAFLLATSAHFENLFSQQTYGILGLGFDSLSQVNAAVTKSGDVWGRTILTNLFYDNPSTPNYIAFLLDRASDLDTLSKGSFTVGEMEPTYAGVIKQPALPVWPNQNFRRWTVIMDGLTVNDFPVALSSNLVGGPTTGSVVLLDSGASFAFGPKAYIDAIYSKVLGSYYYAKEKVWIMPCDATAKVSLLFGGQHYDVHPLDLSYPVVINFADGRSVTICAAAMLENSEASTSPDFDWLLGDTFLRNVYAMYDFGDLDTSTGGLVGHPFIKLLPLPTSAYSSAATEFKNARAATLAKLPPQANPKDYPTVLGVSASVSNAADTANSASRGGSASAPQSPSRYQLNIDSGNSVDTPTLNELHDDMGKLIKYIPYILGLLGGGVFLSLILLIVACVFLAKRGKNRGRTYQPITH